MLNIEKPANEIWDTVETHLNCWLAERQTLINTYYEISGLKTYEKQSAPNQYKLQQFCEQLVDYVSRGHFGIYEELNLEAKVFSIQAGNLNRTYQQIEETTEVALEFNDKYDLDIIPQDCIKQDLRNDLSKIGEAMALRFDLEDHLINLLHRKNKEIAA